MDQARILEYIRTIPAVFKVVEMVLLLITIICGMIHIEYWAPIGGGWVVFCAFASLFAVFVIFMLSLTGVIAKLPIPQKMMLIMLLIFHIFMAVVWFTNFIVITVQTSKEIDPYRPPSNYVAFAAAKTASVRATAAFSFFDMVVFIGDSIFCFINVRNVTAATTTTPPPNTVVGAVPAQQQPPTVITISNPPPQQEPKY